MRRRTRPINRRSMFVAFFSLFAVTTALSQTGSSPEQNRKSPSIKLRTSLVLVPAVVTDRLGAPVAGLTRNSFTVLENGHPQKIAFFEHIQTQAEPVRRTVAAPGTFTNTIEASSQRLTIFVMDLLNSSIAEQENGRDELVKLFSKSGGIKEPFCLLTLDSDGLTVIHDFTTDPTLLAEALKQVKEHASAKDAPQINPMELTYRNFHGWHTRSVNRAIATLAGRASLLASAIRSQAITETLRTRLTLEALREIGEAFVGMPGRKSLIWATGGFPFEIDDPSQFGARERDLLPEYEKAWRALNRADIAVYPLDVEQLASTALVSASVGQPLPEHFDIRSNVTNLERFADVTGGKLCDRSTDAETCFRKATTDSSDYYLLGFYQGSATTKSGWQKLSVRTNVPNVQVRARAGYYLSERRDDLHTREEDLQTALASPLDYTAIPLTVRWTATLKWEGNEKRRVGFSFAVPLAAVKLEDEEGGHLSLEFAAMATSETGASVGSFLQTADGKLSEGVAKALKSNGVICQGTIDLPPGEYTMSFAVRDNLNGQIGTVSAPLTVH